MLAYPNIDPVAFTLGPLDVHWYGLMYLCAFLLFLFLGRRHAARRPDLGWQPQQIDDLLFYGVLGVIIGGRLGEVLFFQPEFFFSHPAQIFAIWKGGMSFHGGLIGVLIALAYYGRKSGRGFWNVADFVAPLVPTGLACGRIGNFINGELWGRPASPELPWAMVFPRADLAARHPSQIYQALGEGLLLFCLLWWFSGKPRPSKAVSALFLLGYGTLRFAAEFFRDPTPGIFGTLSLGLSTAQWLCVPMIVIGALLLAHTLRPPVAPVAHSET